MTNHEWQLWRNHRRPFICARLAAFVGSAFCLFLNGLVEFVLFRIGLEVLQSASATELGGLTTRERLYVLVLMNCAAMLPLSRVFVAYGLYEIKRVVVGDVFEWRWVAT